MGIALLLALPVLGAPSLGARPQSGAELAHPQSSKPRARGVIVIMADDAGVECFGCYGGQSYATPHIDRLAESGMRFDHVHSQPLCTPSRVKLMTGRSNVRNYSDFMVLLPGERTFAHSFADAGRVTGVMGKWQLYGAGRKGERAGRGTRPGEVGFQNHRVWKVEARGSRYWAPVWEEDGLVHHGTEDEYGPDIFLQYGIDFLRAHHDEDFLLYWPMCLPHDPFVPPPPGPTRGKDSRPEDFGPMVEYLDGLVGRLVAELDRLGIRQQTLLVFTSDNGTSRHITSRWRRQEVAGAKGLTLDTGTHVPLIVSWPGVVEPGTVCDDLIDFSDFFPTMCEAAEVPVPEGLDGRSFLPQARGEPGNPRDHLFSYYYPRPGDERVPEQRWVRDRQWKLYGDGRLFDVLADPLERRPLSEEGSSPETRARRAELAEVLAAWPEHGEKIASQPSSASGDEDGGNDGGI